MLGLSLSLTWLPQQVRPPLPSEVQAFDGPAPETINSRLAMLGVTSALAAEFATGVRYRSPLVLTLNRLLKLSRKETRNLVAQLGVKEQVAQQPVGIILVFALISLASYVPIVRLDFTLYSLCPYAELNPVHLC